MKDKKIRYWTTFLAWDRVNDCFSLALWDDDNCNEYLSDYEKRYGFKLIDPIPKVFVNLAGM